MTRSFFLKRVINVLAFSGCAALGGLFGDKKLSFNEVVQNALRFGINYIDTSYWFNQAKCEELLGQVRLIFPYCNTAALALATPRRIEGEREER